MFPKNRYSKRYEKYKDASRQQRQYALLKQNGKVKQTRVMWPKVGIFGHIDKATTHKQTYKSQQIYKDSKEESRLKDKQQAASS